MEETVKELIKKELRGIINARNKALNKIAPENLDFNPFLIRVLGLSSPRQIAEFMINERLERSVVTSFGQRIQKIIKLIGGQGSGAEGSDIQLEKSGRRYYIQIKSGPNTPNKDIVTSINRLLQSAARRNSGSIPMLGMTYGKREQVSGIIQQYSTIDWKIGNEFWDFIGEKDIAHEIYEIIDELNREPNIGNEEDFTARYNTKLIELENEIKERYGDGDEMWDKLFDDNM